MRPTVWKLLLVFIMMPLCNIKGYIPSNSERRREVLLRKRTEYIESLRSTYTAEKDTGEQSMLKQV